MHCWDSLKNLSCTCTDSTKEQSVNSRQAAPQPSFTQTKPSQVTCAICVLFLIYCSEHETRWNSISTYAMEGNAGRWRLCNSHQMGKIMPETRFCYRCYITCWIFHSQIYSGIPKWDVEHFRDSPVVLIRFQQQTITLTWNNSPELKLQ